MHSTLAAGAMAGISIGASLSGGSSVNATASDQTVTKGVLQGEWAPLWGSPAPRPPGTVRCMTKPANLAFTIYQGARQCRAQQGLKNDPRP